MATARAFHVLKPSGVRVVFKRGGGVHRHTMVLANKIASASKVRLGMSPKRIDTGRLRASITVVPFTTAQRVPGARVGTNVEYAIYVFYGTRYMEANPFLTDAVDAVLR